ncbi:transglycosylase SLT domain-containing protein [Radiobacillus sp. PE A8.2]|uniref:transglycosylase SLT domain-containing protein n=1 Tax=Radiobacillus sp. PE A8.2 TaxID=3380349 RepID=UPI003890C70E
MRKTTIFSTIAMITLIIGIIGFGNMVQVQKAESHALQTENIQLVEENEQLKAQNKYMKMDTADTSDVNYNTWAAMETQAQLMVEDSEGNFKKPWALFLVKEADRYEMDPYLVYELLKVETGHTFDPYLEGPETIYGRAYGLAQFMKNTAPWIADMAGLPYEDELLFDPYYSIQLSFVYLDFLHGEYGNWNEALTAYHRGMAGMEQYKEENGHAASTYATVIQERAEDHSDLVVVR